MRDAALAFSMPPTTISDADFDALREIVHHRIGLTLCPSKKSLVVSRLGRHLQSLNMRNFSEYLDYLEHEPRAYQEMIGRITTHYTGFFRERIQFDLLREEILPTLVKRRHEQCRLRIWSAACSSGEELYSILIEVLDFFGGHIPADWDVKILGTDIDLGSLQRARQGIFGLESVATIPPDRLMRYFVQSGDREYTFKSQLSHCLRLGQLNLNSTRLPFKQKLDIVFCRNVAIYFDSDGKDRLYHTLHRWLMPDGYLFSGHSESLLRFPDLFKPYKRSIYVKRDAKGI